MTAILSKLFSLVMTIIVSLSSAYPSLFDGEVYIDPNGDKVSYVKGIVYEKKQM